VGEHQVVIGRLTKRIAKLTQQREFFRQRCVHYAEVLNLHQSIEIRHRSFTEQMAERERIRGLEQRIKEQALLIEKLRSPPGGEG
jgi:ppGpp synthetase/RelA/SpoT-type nucleotidyltranferase